MDATRTTLERQADTLLGGTGARRSGPRKRVLMFLLEQERALTRGEIQRDMAGKPLGGVTLHRVLAWLAANGLVQRIACAGQARRFCANRETASHAHAHFQCLACGQVTCLDEVPLPSAIPVPHGYTRKEIDFLVNGTCPRCNGGTNA